MMRKSCLLALLFAICTWAQESSDGLNDFEKSLMNNEPAAESQGSDEFEQSLMQQSSEMEPVYKTREELLSAIKAKNSQQVAKVMAELESMESKTLIPVNDIEKEAIYVEMRMYKSLLATLVQHYRNFFDSTRYDNPKVATGDGLDYHVRQLLQEREKSDKNIFYTVEKGVDFKKVPLQQRQKLELFLLLRDAYRDSEINERVRELSKIVSEDKNDPDAEWVRKCIYEPTHRMQLFSYSLEKRKENKEDLIQKKLYTGGFGLNLYIPVGGMGFGYDEFYREDLFAPADPFINLELYFQIYRVAVLYEYVNSGVSGLNSYEFGLGWVAYDSRYVKVRPYVAVGKSFVDLEPINDIPNFPSSSQSYGNSSGSKTFTAAVNVDYKFATPYFFLSDTKLTSFYVSSKLGISYIDFEHTYAKGSGVTPFFALGLGTYFW